MFDGNSKENCTLNGLECCERNIAKHYGQCLQGNSKVELRAFKVQTFVVKSVSYEMSSCKCETWQMSLCPSILRLSSNSCIQSRKLCWIKKDPSEHHQLE